MADSNITKRALANALKELMTQVPFNKINIADICDKCDMNRKSFYYHFKDKYDLVNWIFDVEFLSEVKKNSYSTSWEFMYDLCTYLYENRTFYRRAFAITGQNSFSEYFIDALLPLFYKRLKRIAPNEEVKDFQITTFADFFLITIKRWIMEKDCLQPDPFLHSLETMIHNAAIKICEELEAHKTTI